MANAQKPTDIDGYVSQFPVDMRAVLRDVREAIRRAAPDVVETISYQMPAFRQHGILVYFAAWKKHVGLYPPISGDTAIEKAAARYAGPKGSLQFPLDEPMPLALIERIVRLRVKQDAAKAAAKRSKRSQAARNPHDAEDAFQATFLVLVQKAVMVVPREMVANWLYGGAHQTSVRLRALAAKRGRREAQMSELPEPTAAEARDEELLALLDQELSRLPERFRALIVMCDLEGYTRKDVARQLGCPEGTVASGLARARALLAKRLT